MGYQGYRDRDRVVELVLVLTTSDSNCRIATVRFAGDLITYQGAVFFHEKTCGRLGVIPNRVTWLYPRDSEVYARVGWISRAKLAHVQCRVDEEIDRARAVPELPYPFEDEDGELLESTAEPVLE